MKKVMMDDIKLKSKIQVEIVNQLTRKLKMYLLTYLWRPQAGRHMVPPDFPISHQRSQLSRVPSTGVSA